MNSAPSTEEILKLIVMGLVKNPEKVEIKKKITEMGTLLEIHCVPEDRQYVIGKRGSTFRLLSGLMRKIGAKNKQAVSLKIYEENDQRKTTNK